MAYFNPQVGVRLYRYHAYGKYIEEISSIKRVLKKYVELENGAKVNLDGFARGSDIWSRTSWRELTPEIEKKAFFQIAVRKLQNKCEDLKKVINFDNCSHMSVEYLNDSISELDAIISKIENKDVPKDQEQEKINQA